jgi:transcription elongation factor GreA
MDGKVYVTFDRVKEIENEIHQLKSVERKKIAQKIADARSHGDLSENAEYDAAKEEQGMLEMKISRLESTLARVEVIKPEEMPNDKVYILSKVKLKNLKANMIVDYTMVSDEEADFEKRKLSVTSPIGSAIMGKKIGDVIDVKVPAGNIKFEILDITR